MPPVTSIRARFGWFALGHICVSLIGTGSIAVFFFALNGGAGWMGNGRLLPWLLCAALMLLYLPAGYLVAKRRRWTYPSHPHSVLAVLLPALAAWVFAAVSLALAFGMRWSNVGMVLLLSTFAWASPSFLLMLCSLELVFFNTISGIFYVFAFFAGLFPPLLFHWGSLLGARQDFNDNSMGNPF